MSQSQSLSVETSVLWVLRCERQLLLAAGSNAPFPQCLADELDVLGSPLPVGEWDGLPCHAADVSRFPDLPGVRPAPLRDLFALAGESAFALAGRAVQLLDWQRQHGHCGACGTPTVRKPGEMAMACPECGLVVYPRISPAIMVLVRRGRELLLARSPRFKPGVFSALAGFVEAGETLEECVVREVREEVGIEIANLRYFASQSWPFPNSLMIAFFADYASGEITPDPVEIEAADWFLPEDLPLLPEPISLSRRLIDAALSGPNAPESQSLLK